MFGSRLKHICFAACMLMSLLIGTASACACTHHAPELEQIETETSSCHSPAKNSESQQTENNADCFASGNGCVCAASVERTATKSEAVKIKKTVAAIVPDVLATSEISEQQMEITTNFVAKPLYLSDSFYNLARKRGPPRA